MQKTILITGTSIGFGKDAALTLGAAGHRVFATMRDVKGRNRAAAQELRARDITVVELDVKKDASVAAAFDTVFVTSSSFPFDGGLSHAFTVPEAQPHRPG